MLSCRALALLLLGACTTSAWRPIFRGHLAPRPAAAAMRCGTPLLCAPPPQRGRGRGARGSGRAAGRGRGGRGGGARGRGGGRGGGGAPVKIRYIPEMEMEESVKAAALSQGFEEGQAIMLSAATML